MVNRTDLNVKTVTVVGANGTMGTNVAGIFASFGGADVFMVCRDLEKSKKAIDKAYHSVRADSIKGKMHPADYSMLEECVKQSDLVFESVAENLNIKEDITKRIGEHINRGAFICSGTSGLSINEIASCLPCELRPNYYGVHMFNPPYSLSLCELIPSRDSNPQTTEALANYLKNTLLRTVINTADVPAFLANRIGFNFMNKALQYADKYKLRGGIDYIDAILGTFSGRLMSPLVTVDFVGLDIHEAIVENVYDNADDYEKESFKLPKYVVDLIETGRLGRKVGEGLYKSVVLEDGRRLRLVFDINLKQYRPIEKYNFAFAQKMNDCIKDGNYFDAVNALVNDKSDEAKICLEFLIDYIVYALNMSEKTSRDITAADDAMAMGFNWCPPLAMLELLSSAVNVEKKAKAFGIKGTETGVLSRAKKSKYDYRPFFRASK